MIGAHATTYPLRSGVPDITGVGRAGDLIAPEVFAVPAPLKGLFPPRWRGDGFGGRLRRASCMGIGCGNGRPSS